jgi:hypothetical protein
MSRKEAQANPEYRKKDSLSQFCKREADFPWGLRVDDARSSAPPKRPSFAAEGWPQDVANTIFGDT